MTLTSLGIISMACFTLAYVPQLLRTYRTRNVQGLSPTYWGIIVAGYVSGVGYIWPFEELWLRVTYLAGLACASAMLIGYFAFRQR